MKSERAIGLMKNTSFQNGFCSSRLNGQEGHYVMAIRDVGEAVEIAEQEAEERCAEQMQKVRDECARDIKLFTERWDAADKKMDAIHQKEMQELRDKAVEAFGMCCNVNFDGWCHLQTWEKECMCRFWECDIKKLFIEKLNEK